MAEFVGEEKQAKRAEKAEPAVTSKPRSAAFLVGLYILNAILLLIFAYYVAAVYILLKNCDSKWMSLGFIAVVTLCVGLILHAILVWRGEHIEEYAVAANALAGNV